MDGAGRVRVVVVDDDKPVLRLLRDVLEGEGYRVTALSQPPQALADLAFLAPDLVILDLHFRDGTDASALLAAYKTDPASNDAPVLVCSAARHLLERMADDLERWSCAVVPKPFDIDALLAAVEECLRPSLRQEAAG